MSKTQKILSKCINNNCNGEIVEIEKVIVTEHDLIDGVIAVCNKCNEDFTSEIYG